MFERFTDRARRVVVLAQEEARILNHNYIGTEHILLALIEEGEGVAAMALRALNVGEARVRAEIDERVSPGTTTPSGHIPFTPRAKKVLELSLREALQLGHSYLGTEHILLGLVREGEGIASQVLVALGVDVERVRDQVILILSGMADEDVVEGVPEGLGERVTARSSVSGSAEAVASSIGALGGGLTPLLQRALLGVSEEAANRGHARAGTEHVLLWLLGQLDSGAMAALRDEEVDIAALASRLEQILAEAGGSTDPS